MRSTRPSRISPGASARRSSRRHRRGRLERAAARASRRAPAGAGAPIEGFSGLDGKSRGASPEEPAAAISATSPAVCCPLPRSRGLVGSRRPERRHVAARAGGRRVGAGTIGWLAELLGFPPHSGYFGRGRRWPTRSLSRRAALVRAQARRRRDAAGRPRAAGARDLRQRGTSPPTTRRYVRWGSVRASSARSRSTSAMGCA